MSSPNRPSERPAWRRAASAGGWLSLLLVVIFSANVTLAIAGSHWGLVLAWSCALLSALNVWLGELRAEYRNEIHQIELKFARMGGGR